MKAIETEEKQLREKNLNLQRKLQMEIDRREALHRHLSESESSLEMDEERLLDNVFFSQAHFTSVNYEIIIMSFFLILANRSWTFHWIKW